MEEKQINKELLRLAVITLLIACMFGILQYFPEGKTFDSININVILKIIASTMFQAPLPIFIAYLISLGLNLRYEKKKIFLKAQAFFYDLGIFLTTFIIIFTILFISLVWLLMKIPTFPMWIIVGAIWSFIIASAVILYITIKNHLEK